MKMVGLGSAFAAATMLASTGGALASSTTVGLDSFCDVMTITLNQDVNTGKNTIAAMNEDPACTADIMDGFEVKIPGYKNKWVFVGGPRFGDGFTAWGFLFQFPFNTGNVWGLYNTTDGVNTNLIVSGTYTVNPAKGQNAGPPAGKGAKSPLHENHGNLPQTLR